MIRINKISKNELLLGLLIISVCCFITTLLNPPVIETTLYVKINPIEELKCNTSEEGKVSCYVKK